MSKAAMEAVTAKAEQEAKEDANFDRFYAAIHKNRMTAEVVKMAAFATSAQRTLTELDRAMDLYPEEREKIKRHVEALGDWQEFPTGIEWSLRYASMELEAATNEMEAAFMTALKLRGTT